MAANPVGFIDPSGLSRQERLKSVSDFAAGFGDAVTFGGTNWIRNKIGVNSSVDKTSGWYTGGEAAGYGSTIIATAGFTAETLGAKVIVQTRASAGADGATSQIIKVVSKLSGRTINVTHQVIKDGEIIHKHYKFRSFLPF